MAPDSGSAPAADAAPELVLTGVRLWTAGSAAASLTSPNGSNGSNGSNGPAGAIAVRAGRIVAIGTDADVLAACSAGTRRLHLPGRLVVAGFQDAHVHPPFAGRFLLNLGLHDLSSTPEYRTAIAGYAAENPHEEWIYGAGWEVERFAAGGPTRDLLDDVLPDRPVFLFNASMHEAWVNSAALRRAGVTRDTPDPTDGRYVRDPSTGEPTGHLIEGAAYRFEATHLPGVSQAQCEAAIVAAQSHLHALGVTGWQDAWVSPQTLAAYGALADDGRLSARVVAALWWERDRGLEQIPEFVEQRRWGTRPGRLLPRTVKIMVDGVMENHTASLLSPYQDGCGGHTGGQGLTYVEPDLLAAAVTELDALGFQVHLHTIGDRAVRSALDAIEVARRTNGDRDNRHHLAHLQLIHPDDVPRFAALGVVANCQAYWAQSEPAMDELTIPFIGDQRAGQQYPFGSLARSGAVLAMGSDWSVSTADPLRQIEVAVRRVDPDRRATAPFLPEERLTTSQALTAFTAGSAYVNHDPDAGRLAVGLRADLAVLDHDPFGPDNGDPGGDIADATVEWTLAAGRLVHQPRT